MSDRERSAQPSTHTQNDYLRKHWDRIAQDMPDILAAASTRYYRQMEIDLLRRTFGSLRDKKVLKLDLWNEAVNTRILNWMTDEGALAYGLDISFHTARRAERNASPHRCGPHVMQAEIRNFPFAKETFDFVYTMGTIEHIDDYEAPIREIARVLNPGGKAIIGVPHKWDLFLRPVLVGVLSMMGKYLYAPEKSLSAGDLRRAVERSGLRVIERTGLLLMPGVLRMADLFCYTRGIPLHKVTPLLLWPFEKLERRFSLARKFGYLLAIVAAKPRI